MKSIERKITKIGNSLGVTFPSELLSALNIEKGDEVQIDVVEDQIIIKKSKKINLPNGLSEDFFEVLKETCEKYDETIKGLKDR